jgi:hypothetical protein
MQPNVIFCAPYRKLPNHSGQWAPGLAGKPMKKADHEKASPDKGHKRVWWLKAIDEWGLV